MMKRCAISFALACAVSLPTANAVFVSNPDANTLWRENGSNIVVGGPNSPDQWRGGALSFTPLASGGFVLKGDDPEAKKVSTGRYVPLNQQYPYMVLDIPKVEYGQGYRALDIILSNGSTQVFGSVRTVTSVQDGLFTVRMLPVGLKPPPIGYLSIYLYNTAITLQSIKMVKQPANNLEILPPAGASVVKPGDEVTFRVSLEKPAEDVTLTFFDSYMMPQAALNGQARLQLKPEDEDQKIWSAKVKLQSLTHLGVAGGVDLKAGGLMARATILGGAIKRPLWTWNTVEFNFKGAGQ